MALWTPEYIDTALWLDAADSSTITESGGAVSQWADKSGNSRHLSQADAAHQPVSGTRTINGLNAIDLYPSSVPSSLSITGGIATTTNTVWVYIVAVHDTWVLGANTNGMAGLFNFSFDGANNRFYGGFSQYYLPNPSLGARVGDTSGSNDLVMGQGVAGDAFLLGIGRNYQTGGKLYKDGSLIDTLDSIANTLPVTSNAYAAIGNSSSDSFWDGTIGECLILRDEPDTTTRQKIEGYLAYKWGIEANLPIDHPYKSAAPTLPSLSGIIRDRFGNPCQRKVYAVSRPTDTTAPQIIAHGLSDAITGAYELDIPTAEEVTRVVVSEDDDPLLNDLVDRVIPA